MIKRVYNNIKYLFGKRFKPRVQDYTFDLVTDVYLTKEGYQRLVKRKAIMLYHLKKYFKVKPR